MNKTEEHVYDYLKSKGYTSIIFEPDGHIPPDFLVDNHYAIEVRRLNQNFINNDNYEGLEETEIPLYMKVDEILSSFDRVSDSSWFVWFRFSRPTASLKIIEESLNSFLKEFLEKDIKETVDAKLDCGLEVKVFKAEKEYEKTFLVGGYSDLDSGGWVIKEMKKNIKICIDERSKKIEQYKQKYQEWWLFLVD
ncbi:MAG: hypothetical protein ACOCRO_09655, partial [Halanaerobiales bacterium]